MENAVIQSNQYITDVDKSLKLMELAEVLYRSGMYSNIKNAYQAKLIVQYGDELGIPPVTSLQSMSIIVGKLSIDAKMLIGLFQKNGGRISKVIKNTDTECTLEVSYMGQTLQGTYTLDIARKNGLVEKQGSHYKKNPALMLYYRCASQLIRQIAPGTISGLYCKEEMPEQEETHYGFDNAKNITPEKDNEPEPEENKKQTTLLDAIEEIWPRIQDEYTNTYKDASEVVKSIENIYHFNNKRITQKFIDRILEDTDSFIKWFASQHENTKEEDEPQNIYTVIESCMDEINENIGGNAAFDFQEIQEVLSKEDIEFLDPTDSKESIAYLVATAFSRKKQKELNDAVMKPKSEESLI